MSQLAHDKPSLPEQPAVQEPPAAGPHVARAGRYFRNVRYLIFAAGLFFGLYFLYDGFIGYPRERAEYRRLEQAIVEAQNRGEPIAELRREQAEYDDHNDAAIILQRVLGFGLVPLSILLLIRCLYISRGEIRLDEQDTLHVPGREPIAATSLESVDDTLWERKGIAVVHYRDAGLNHGQVKLDDFVYDRAPIDAIHERLKHLILTRESSGQ